jgi:hypothetical protein
MTYSGRYADLADRHLAATLAVEDAAEAQDLSPLERITCYTHRRWVHECIASPLHVIVVTGHRWCRQCQTAATAAVDELSCTVSVTCPRCRQTLDTPAARQIIRTCNASLTAKHEHQSPALAKRPPRTNTPTSSGRPKMHLTQGIHG